MCSSRTARWTCTSAGCGKRSHPASTTASWRPCGERDTGSCRRDSVEGEWGWIVAIALLAGVIAYHERNVRAISRWLERPDAPDPPRTFGAWDRLHARLHHDRRAAAAREQELAQANERWRAAARALPDGVVILDGDRIAWANDTARHHLEIDP